MARFLLNKAQMVGNVLKFNPKNVQPKILITRRYPFNSERSDLLGYVRYNLQCVPVSVPFFCKSQVTTTVFCCASTFTEGNGNTHFLTKTNVYLKSYLHI